MKKVILKYQKHDVSIGDTCGPIKPNIIEDTLFLDESGAVIGFYLRDLAEHSKKASTLANVANTELRTSNVPKTTMNRTSGTHDPSAKVDQYSTIIGSVPPRPHMRRPYASISSVHNKPKAKTFIKAMHMLAKEAANLILLYAPEIHAQQLKLIEENVPKKYQFTNMFTSSISNYNISAPYHKDGGNIEGCVNVIIAKKRDATGGNTTIPDYGATVNSSDNSLLVYPAWRNVHGVTPIEPHNPQGYRNTLVFYPLKLFKGQS